MIKRGSIVLVAAENDVFEDDKIAIVERVEGEFVFVQYLDKTSMEGHKISLTDVIFLAQFKGNIWTDVLARPCSSMYEMLGSIQFTNLRINSAILKVIR